MRIIKRPQASFPLYVSALQHCIVNCAAGAAAQFATNSQASIERSIDAPRAALSSPCPDKCQGGCLVQP